MKYIDFKKFTNENGAQPIYLFEGEEAYFRDKGVEMLCNKYMSQPELNYTTFDGTTLKGDKLKSLIDALNSFPFASEKRIVKVINFHPTEKDFKFYLASLFDNPPLDSIFIIVNEGKNKKEGIDLARKKNVTYVDCSKSDRSTIIKWITIMFRRSGIYIDYNMASILSEYCVDSMSRVEMETYKLIEYCQGKGLDTLTENIIKELVYPDSEYKIYELSNAVSRKDYSEYIHIQDELMTKGFDEIALLNTLSYHFKGLYEISLCHGGDKQIADDLGLKEYAVKKKREQAARFSKEKLFEYYNKIYQAVCSIKCGELTPQSALKMVTASIFFGVNN